MWGNTLKWWHEQAKKAAREAEISTGCMWMFLVLVWIISLIPYPVAYWLAKYLKKHE